MKTKFFIALFAITIGVLHTTQAQWVTSGSNIYYNGGNVGIGVVSPTDKLHVNGNINIPQLSSFGMSASVDKFIYDTKNVGNYSLGWYNDSGQPGAATGYLSSYGGLKLFTNATQRFYITLNGNVGIGTGTPNRRLSISGAETTNPSLLITNTSYNSTNTTGTVSMQFGFADHVGPKIEAFKLTGNTTGIKLYTEYGFNTNQLAMTIRPTGEVGIGTDIPDAKLAVKGTIHAQEVRVDLNVPGPDYVFDDNYKLFSLAELDQYLKINKHLPDVQPAKQMENEGLNVGELNMILLKKVEELTLYVIEINKKVERLEMENKALQKAHPKK